MWVDAFMIRIVKDGKVVFETDQIQHITEELILHDYDVKEIVVNIDREMVEKKYGRI
jgi:ABC-type cobalamin/Fe3+-siderophores transport system ATPase subunit